MTTTEKTVTLTLTAAEAEILLKALVGEASHYEACRMPAEAKATRSLRTRVRTATVEIRKEAR